MGGKAFMKEFDLESLSEFDGKDGRPCYIAYGEKVIDVSESRLWKSGSHMKRHQAGRELTSDIAAAPHGLEVLDKYPQVGVLKKREPERYLPDSLEKLLERFPFLRRHPHPMAVHFPIVFSISPAVFDLLYLFTGMDSFETTALHCLGGSVFFILPAVATGFMTWLVNYQAKPMRFISIKINSSLVLLAVAAIAFFWRISAREAFVADGKEAVVYLILLVSMAILVSVTGFYGGRLTFPADKK